MYVGDLCRVKAEFLEIPCEFMGIFLGMHSSSGPWYKVSFLHGDSVENILLMKSEIPKCVEVLYEAR